MQSRAQFTGLNRLDQISICACVEPFYEIRLRAFCRQQNEVTRRGRAVCASTAAYLWSIHPWQHPVEQCEVRRTLISDHLESRVAVLGDGRLVAPRREQARQEPGGDAVVFGNQDTH